MKAKILFFLLYISLVSCDFNKKYHNRESDFNDASDVVQSFYKFLQQGKNDMAFSLIHPSVWKQNDSVKLSQYFINMGKLQNESVKRTIDHWTTDLVVGYQPSSSYKLYYIDQYKNFSLKVSISLIKDRSLGIKIIGYNAGEKEFSNN